MTKKGGAMEGGLRDSYVCIEIDIKGKMFIPGYLGTMRFFPYIIQRVDNYPELLCRSRFRIYFKDFSAS